MLDFWECNHEYWESDEVNRNPSCVVSFLKNTRKQKRNQFVWYPKQMWTHPLSSNRIFNELSINSNENIDKILLFTANKNRFRQKINNRKTHKRLKSHYCKTNNQFKFLFIFVYVYPSVVNINIIHIILCVYSFSFLFHSVCVSSIQFILCVCVCGGSLVKHINVCLYTSTFTNKRSTTTK